MSRIREIRFYMMLRSYRNWKHGISRLFPNTPKENHEFKSQFYYWKKSYLNSLREEGLIK